MSSFEHCKRLVVKVGTSTLTHSSGHLNLRRVDELVKVLSDLKNSGIEIVLVSSGAVGVGVGELGLRERPNTLGGKQAAAAVGQCALMYMYDKEFAESHYRPQVDWLRKENDDIYDPSYVDILRVALAVKFSRGKMADLVSLLSGRNFETREFEEQIKEDTYKQLADGVCSFINETNFKRFVMIIRSAGFCNSRLIRSQNTLNFAYILFLKLREKKYKPELIEKYVRRWFVYSILRGRYSMSPESNFDYDAKQIDKCDDFGKYLAEVEAADLSDAYWDFGAIQQLNTSVDSSPIFNVFLASQCFQNRKGFLSTAITVQDMISQKGDVHHIFPREYLKSKGMSRSEYNQVANYVYTQTEINIKIGKKAPKDYLGYVNDVQCAGGETMYGGITDLAALQANLVGDCCVPVDVIGMSIDDYPTFLEERRKLIAQRLKEYYFSL